MRHSHPTAAIVNARPVCFFSFRASSGVYSQLIPLLQIQQLGAFATLCSRRCSASERPSWAPAPQTQLHPAQVFAAVLSRSPSSDGVAVLQDTMDRLVPAVPDAAAHHEQQLLNAYTAEGHLRLVEVLIVPLSAEVVISLWTTLDSVRSCFTYFIDFDPI